MTLDAAKHTSIILQQHDYNMYKTFSTVTTCTQLEYRSKFHPAAELEPILKHHNLWNCTKLILLQGSAITLQQLDPAVYKIYVSLGLKRGNHKGATNQPDPSHTLVSKGLDHGFTIPITTKAASTINMGFWFPSRLFRVSQ